MKFVINIFNRINLWLSSFIGAFTSLVVLAIKGINAVRGRDLPAFLAKPTHQRHIFTVLRFFWPNLSLSRRFVKNYDNIGTVIVTRHQDVVDVLNRNEDFEVVYGSRMKILTGGENFFLGMQPSWAYTRDRSAMNLAARKTDVEDIIVPRARQLAERALDNSKKKIDIVSVLTLHIPWDMTDHYFGVGATAENMQKWTTFLFYYLFQDLDANSELDKKTYRHAEELRTYLDDAIKVEKNNTKKNNTILARCLELQKVDTPGMEDIGIRNNLLGLLIGAIPTISKACCLAMDELLDRPDKLEGARQAALACDDHLFENYIWEALRFRPFNPVIYRRAAKDSIISKGTLRAHKVKKGEMVFASNFSASFDQRIIHKANEFRTDRPWEDYMIWGYGMHSCFGGAINKAIIPEILKPLIKKQNLRRADDEAGYPQSDEMGFPTNFILEFD